MTVCGLNGRAGIDMRRMIPTILLLALGAAGCAGTGNGGNSVASEEAGSYQDANSPGGAVRLFPLKDVRLLESPFSNAVTINRRYLLAHDPDRLLAPYRREA